MSCRGNFTSQRKHLPVFPQRGLKLPQYLGVHARMLPNIELVQMKAERPQLAKQGIDAAVRQSLSLMSPQAVAYQQQILLKLSVAAVCCAVVKLESLPQSVPNVREKSTVTLRVVLL